MTGIEEHLPDGQHHQQRYWDADPVAGSAAAVMMPSD
jgi:hypothetical protein